MTTSYHHGDLKAALLAYAREQLERQQLENLSMREMAKAIGVSHTAAYRHFANKDALLDAVAVQGFKELLASCMQAVQHAANEPRARLRACGLAYVGYGASAPHLLTHMFNSVALPNATTELREAGAQLFQLLLSLVGEGQEQGAFRVGDTRELAQACWAVVHGLSHLLSLNLVTLPKKPGDESMQGAAVAVDVFLDGLQELS